MCSLLVLLSFCIIYISALAEDCVNDFIGIELEHCVDDSNVSTIAVQSFKSIDFDISSYTSISLFIEGSYDLVIEPHCVSLLPEDTISIDLIRSWLLSESLWPIYHQQGNIIKYDKKTNYSQYITFNNSCILNENLTNYIILLFNNDLWNIDAINCLDPDNNMYTLYDTLFDYDEICTVNQSKKSIPNINWNFDLNSNNIDNKMDIDTTTISPTPNIVYIVNTEIIYKDNNYSINWLLIINESTIFYIIIILILLLCCSIIICCICCKNCKKGSQTDRATDNSNKNVQNDNNIIILSLDDDSGDSADSADSADSGDSGDSDDDDYHVNHQTTDTKSYTISLKPARSDAAINIISSGHNILPSNSSTVTNNDIHPNIPQILHKNNDQNSKNSNVKLDINSNLLNKPIGYRYHHSKRSTNLSANFNMNVINDIVALPVSTDDNSIDLISSAAENYANNAVPSMHIVDSCDRDTQIGSLPSLPNGNINNNNAAIYNGVVVYNGYGEYDDNISLTQDTVPIGITPTAIDGYLNVDYNTNHQSQHQHKLSVNTLDQSEFADSILDDDYHDDLDDILKELNDFGNENDDNDDNIAKPMTSTANHDNDDKIEKQNMSSIMNTNGIRVTSVSFSKSTKSKPNSKSKSTCTEMSIPKPTTPSNTNQDTSCRSLLPVPPTTPSISAVSLSIPLPAYHHGTIFNSMSTNECIPFNNFMLNNNNKSLVNKINSKIKKNNKNLAPPPPPMKVTVDDINVIHK